MGDLFEATPHATCDSDYWVRLVDEVYVASEGKLRIGSRLLVRVVLSDEEADRVIAAAEKKLGAGTGLVKKPKRFNYSTRDGSTRSFGIGQYQLEVLDVEEESNSK